MVALYVAAAGLSGRSDWRRVWTDRLHGSRTDRAAAPPEEAERPEHPEKPEKPQAPSPAPMPRTGRRARRRAASTYT